VDYETLLFLHLVGAFLFVAGATVAAVVQLAARGRERPSEVATLLRVARTGVLLVVVGTVVLFVFGAWLAEHAGYGLDAPWVSWAMGLLVLSLVLGGLGGRKDRHTRELAERLAAEGDEPSEELSRRLRDPLAAAANWASGALVVVIIVLMVWKPG
jgi:uncharacterized membrane protein